MKKVVVILFSLFSLAACQVPTAETLEDPYPPAIKIRAEGKEAIIKPFAGPNVKLILAKDKILDKLL